jgi:hypothetical protein
VVVASVVANRAVVEQIAYHNSSKPAVPDNFVRHTGDTGISVAFLALFISSANTFTDCTPRQDKTEHHNKASMKMVLI